MTVTDPDEARSGRDAGADALVVQGVEAGGHRGAFVDRDGPAALGLLALLQLVRARRRPAARRDRRDRRPARGVAAVLAAGAAAAQLGTAFMLAPEAGTHARAPRGARRATRRPR